MTEETSRSNWKSWEKGLEMSSIGLTGVTMISDRRFPGVL